VVEEEQIRREVELARERYRTDQRKFPRKARVNFHARMQTLQGQCSHTQVILADSCCLEGWVCRACYKRIQVDE
jgi:hypothetical protein